MTNNCKPTPDFKRFSIVANYEFQLTTVDRDRIDSLATRILADEPALNETGVFGESVKSGVGKGVGVHLSNNYDISLLERQTVSNLEYRMSLLAQDGDIFLVRGNRSQAFEQYLSQNLASGSLKVVCIPDSKPGVQISTDRDSPQFNVILSAVRSAVKPGDSLTLFPYIGMSSVWMLASALAREAKIDVYVAAPPPRLTRRVNDKLWFADLVIQVLGEQAVPPVRPAYGPVALTALVRDYAKKYDQVIVKVPDSAGSYGNIKLSSSKLSGVSASVVQDRLLAQLHLRGWHDQFPLMVEVWDTVVLSSPSMQLWIPSISSGGPVIEGIFDQHISASDDSFAGAVVAKLTDEWEHRLVSESMQLAYLLQRLGYYGRVSFDTVIAGHDYDNAQLHWIECNGRWGGVSIPMTLLNRLFGDYRNKQFIIVQNSHVGGAAIPFEQVVLSLRDRLYKHGIDNKGIVFPVPDVAHNTSATNYIAIADNRDDVNELVREVDEHFRAAT